MIAVRDVDLKVNIKEVYRYLGFRGESPEDEIAEKVRTSIDEVVEASQPRAIYERYPLELFDGEEDLAIGGVSFKSRDLKLNLKGCQYVYLMGATIGIGVDRLIARASVGDMTKATIYQAAGAAYVEEYCDYINEEIRKKALEEGMVLRPRFSPGYGDFALENQKDIFRLLNLSKHTGISLSDSMLMSPSKSVTAVIGVKEKEEGSPEREIKKNCKDCPKKDCEFRDERY